MSDGLLRARRLAPVLVAAGAMVGLCAPALAEEVMISPGGDIQRAVSALHAGDVLRLRPGRYPGPVTLDRSIAMIGQPGAVIDGRGNGRVVTVDAPDASVRGLTVVNSGASLAAEDSGIFVTESADRARIVGNRLQHNLIGIYLKGPEGAVVESNVIVGRTDLRMNERGNGVQLWNAPGSVVKDNDVRFGRDGIFVTTSSRNVFRGNRFRDLRFAVHYMYTNDSEVADNVSLGNHVGYAIMFSNRLKVTGNVSQNDRDRGIFLNYANYSDISGNTVGGGAEKCVFIYNANGNDFHGNRFMNCDIGIHFTAGSEQNRIFDNAFMDNRTQVKYVGTRHIEWSVEGRGNYWSDNPAFDLDGDGIADRPYEPNDIVDQIVWRYPASRILFNSPALHLLRWAQSQFPSLHPGGVVDSAPLMAPSRQLRGNG